jgi:hypothetical protein
VADAFISHALCDRSAAKRLARELRDRGLSVRSAPGLFSGARPNDRRLAELYDEFDSAAAIIVLFSHRAAPRSWLASEAAIAQFQGRLIAVALDAGAAPEPFAPSLMPDVSAAALRPRSFGLFGPAVGEEAIDLLAARVRERQEEAQAARVHVAEQLRAEPTAVEGQSAETLARAMRFEFGGRPGDAPTDARRTAFVAALRSMEGASDPEVSAAARAYTAAGGSAPALARLYAAVERERQPLLWRRFGDVAMPQAIYTGLAALERAGLSSRQIDERIAPQTRGALLRARFGDRMVDAVGAGAFAALVMAIAFVGLRALPDGGPSAVSTSIPPVETAALEAPPPPASVPRPTAPPPEIRAEPPVETASAPAPRPAPAPAMRPAPPMDTAALSAPRIAAGADNPCAAGTLSGAAVLTVRPGDTLSAISLQCYGDANAWRQVAQCNGFLEQRNRGGVSPLFGGDLLYVGDRLVLPAPGSGCPA